MISPYEAIRQCSNVFVYGTLMKDQGNSGLLRSATYMGTTRTKERFALGDIGFPYAFPAEVVPEKYRKDLCHPVKGEVYMVHSAYTLESLDHLEGYPQHYDRVVVELDNMSSAWMYVQRDWGCALYCDAAIYKEGVWQWA